MALTYLSLALSTQAMQHRRAQAGAAARLTVLTFGYPDLLVPQDVLVKMFGEALVAGLATRDDAASILRWHSLEDVWTGPFYDSVSLFNALNADVVVSDVAVHRGMERIVDLNEPLPDDLRAKFDIVIDPGTCEHCFNVGQAFRNVCDAVAVGGFLVHSAPLNRTNHGFWNFSPTIYPDYMGDNGFRIDTLMGISGNPRVGYKSEKLEMLKRFTPAADSAILMLAERQKMLPHVWPVQRKYRGIMAKAAATPG